MELDTAPRRTPREREGGFCKPRGEAWNASSPLSGTIPAYTFVSDVRLPELRGHIFLGILVARSWSDVGTVKFGEGGWRVAGSKRTSRGGGKCFNCLSRVWSFDCSWCWALTVTEVTVALCLSCRALKSLRLSQKVMELSRRTAGAERNFLHD